MKKTLLELVQDILSDLSSDEVNSIQDTVEAQQVAQILRSTYESMMTTRNWPHMKKLIQLDAISDLNRPNYLKLPEMLKKLETLSYQIGTDKIEYRELKFKDPDSFLRYINARDSASANIKTVVDASGVKMLIVKDQPPTYWTSFDDQYIITDSWDSTVDDTLQKSKTQAIAYVYPTWVHSDDAIPDLPIEAFPSLREDAKSAAFLVLKQEANPKVEQEARRQSRWLSRKSWRAHGGIQYPNYGRK